MQKGTALQAGGLYRLWVSLQGALVLKRAAPRLGQLPALGLPAAGRRCLTPEQAGKPSSKVCRPAVVLLLLVRGA